jgi:hypothetical protein
MTESPSSPLLMPNLMQAFERRRMIGAVLLGVSALCILPSISEADAKSSGRQRPPQIVGSSAALERALMAADSDTVIMLRPGNYAPFTLRNIQKASDILITSLDTDYPAILGGVAIHDCAGLHFHGLSVQPIMGAASPRFLMDVQRSKRIRLTEIKFTGPADDISALTYSGILLRDSQDLLVAKCQFTGFWNALSFLNISRASIMRNEFWNLRTDGIRGGGASSIEIAENVFTDFFPAKGDHPDAIQFWTTNEKLPARDIIVRDNLVIRGNGQIVQGIFLRDEATTLPYDNVTITGNLLIGTMYNGIMIDGAITARITNNQIIAHKDHKSWIRIERGRHVELHDNRAMHYIIATGSVVTQKGNRVTAPADSGWQKQVVDWASRRPDMTANAGPLLRRLLSSYSQ